MKRFVLLSTIICISGFLLAQVPQAIQYQAVIRDAQGNPLASQSIRLRISVLTDSLTGLSEYTETHQVTTTNLGMVHLAIGQGSVVYGQFSSIHWGSGPRYARVELDMALNGNYTLLATTQLLSVPYALYAGSSAVVVMSTAERDAIPNPPPGMQILNSDNFCLNVYTGNAWIAYCGTCTPQPDPANAGPDLLNIAGTSAILQGNDPVNGSGSWSVISGNGGQVANGSQHNSSFTGHPGASYTLVWTISNSCGSSSDTVQIGFACDPQYIPADAGSDVAICPGGCAQLTATGGASYFWSTQQQLASIQVCPSQTTTYYVTVTDDYGCTAEASVTVTVSPFPNANAGPDVSICLGECTQLQASGGATYLWSTQETTADIQVCPVQTTTYTVTVTDAQGCVATAEVVVTVLPLPLANAGQDVSVCSGECAHLQASGGATYLWSTQETTAEIQVCPAQTTTYIVIVSDVHGCMDSDEVTVSVNTPPVADAGQDTAICPGDCAQLLASGGTTYLWSTQATTAGIQVCPTTVTKYYLTVTDLNACSAVDSVIVEMLPLPDLPNAGPDNLNIAGTTATLQANTPVIGSGQWSIIIGQGGSFADDTVATTQFTGQVGQSYMLVWTISTVCGSLSDTVMIAFPYQQIFVQCGDSLTDTRDGQIYPTVQIGTQCWMAKNLNLGTLITATSEQTNNTTIEKYCYNDNVSNCDIYGGLYQWDEMMDYATTEGAQGICPDGWHLPTDGEWCTLTTFLDPTVNCNLTGSFGTDAGGKMKDTGTTYWNTVNVGATNSSGFSALPAGYRYNGIIYFLNATAAFWSSTETYYSNGTYWYLQNNSAAVYRDILGKTLGFSVRCLLNTTLACTPQPDQANAGPDKLNIAGTTTSLQANTPVNGSGLWSIISGQGGSFADDTLATSLFTGQAGESYVLVWTISNQCGSTSDTVQIGFAQTTPGFGQCGDTLTDARDGKTYNTVLIGTQCWMKENLAYLPSVSPSNLGSATTPFYYVYDYQGTDVTAAKATTNYQTYGVLYNWPAAMDGQASSNSVSSGVQGICPDGWYLPGDEEWKILEGEVDSQFGYPDPVWNNSGWRGTDAGGNLKEAGTTHWNSPNTGATNSSGFAALPGGFRLSSGNFGHMYTYALFWSSAESSTNNAWARGLGHGYSNVNRVISFEGSGVSVRCLRDTAQPCTPQPDQANAGPDNLNIAGTNTSLQANTPVNGSGQWSIISGQGGSFADDTFAISLFTGQAGETYVLVWTISNACGSNSDTVQIGFAQTAPGFGQCGDTLTDTRDGNTYNTVLIGTQCWMKENLAYLPSVSPSNQGSETTPYYYVYNYQGTDITTAKATSNYQTYGVLYNWPAAMAGHASSNTVPSGVQGVCPTGWHIPSDGEWSQLLTYLGGTTIAGGKLKEVGTSHWFNPNTGATDVSGFTALPAGGRYPNGIFNYLGHFIYFWAATESSGTNAWTSGLYYNLASVYWLNYSKSYGFSVRCIKDSIQPCTPQPDQANAGPDQPGICSPATLSANPPSSGSGLWSIITGSNGSFSDETDPGATFTGDPGSSYLLLWTISNQCGSTSDSVEITFLALPDQANAGPDSFNINGTSIALQANTPVNGSGQWAIISGQGGSFADANLATTQFTGQAGESYSLVWTISTQCGSSSDTVIISFAAASFGVPCPNLPTLDYEGQTYNTVLIGSQCWLRENLNVGTMVLGTVDQTDNGIIEKHCYNNDAANCATYGGLYSWNEAMAYVSSPGVRGICPPGFHIPDGGDWDILMAHLGSNTGGKMKETGLLYWSTPNTGATNESGFSARGGGFSYGGNDFMEFNEIARFWSSSFNNPMSARNYMIYYNMSDLVWGHEYPFYSQSVRCLRDTSQPCTPQPDQANAGADNLNIAGTTTTLQANTPVNGSGQWSVVSGQGGSFADATLATSLFTGLAGESYTLVWTISTQCGNSSDTVIISLATVSYGVPCPGVPSVNDFTGNVYNTVMIGTQCWMKENLKTTRYNNGVPIQNVTSDASWNVLASGAYCWYNNDLTSYSATYGALYNWHAVTNSGGLCPTGWHVPSYAEWTTLVNYLGGQTLAGGHLREVGTTNWNADNTGATNSSGFTALPGGRRLNYGGFESVGIAAHFWTSTNSPSMVNAYAAALLTPGTSVSFGGPGVNFGLSVRCIKDAVTPCTPQPDQANAGPDNLNISGSTPSVNLQAIQAVNGTGTWSLFSGTGGSLANSTLHNTLFTGLPGESYTLVWTITNLCGSTTDTVLISFQLPPSSGQPCPGMATFEYGGQIYNTVLIGTQCWMKENLNIGTMIDIAGNQSNNSIIEKFCYGNNESNCTIYGGLYQWNEVMNYVTTAGANGICPPGWHIPMDAEWCDLSVYIDPTVDCNSLSTSGTNVGDKMKESGFNHWFSTNTSATNESGFTALGAGHRAATGAMGTNMKGTATFWSSSQSSSGSAYYRRLASGETTIRRYGEFKQSGFSVRCLRNN